MVQFTGSGYDPKATAHLEELNQTLTQFSKELPELLAKQTELVTEQTTAFQKQLDLSTKQTADIQKLIEVSAQTAKSTAELVEAVKTNAETSKRDTQKAFRVGVIGICAAVVGSGIAIYGIHSDSKSDAAWRKEQSDLLETINGQLANIENRNPVTGENIQAIIDKLDQLQLAEPQ